MLELSVPAGALRVSLPDGPLPARALATDEGDELIGEVLVWIYVGYLSALEYAWYTDDPPSDLPCPRQFRVE